MIMKASKRFNLENSTTNILEDLGENIDSDDPSLNGMTVQVSSTATPAPGGLKSGLFKMDTNKLIMVVTLFVINLLNYMDRNAIAGVLDDVQTYFKIDDSHAGLLQTAFISTYMVFAPLFGYLGDRYTRKWIIIGGISFWCIMTMLGSFVPADKFWLFAIIRCFVGVGEASYSCLAPTIIGDSFADKMRTKVLAVFYLALPMGSGLGFIVGSGVAQAFADWRWAMRITPPIGAVCVLVLVLFFKEPKRGGADGSVVDVNTATVREDMTYLVKNRTFVWMTAGLTFASFVLGGLTWWMPTYVKYAYLSNNQPDDQVAKIFGLVTLISGFIGVLISTCLSSRFRSKIANIDPLICAAGSLIAMPILFTLVIITRSASPVVFWLTASVVVISMCLSWTTMADVLIYAIHPSKRATASAISTLMCHLLGDASSPYVIGAVSDAFRSGLEENWANKFESLQKALLATPLFVGMSFISYVLASRHVIADKKTVDDAIKNDKQQRMREL